MMSVTGEIRTRWIGAVHGFGFLRYQLEPRVTRLLIAADIYRTFDR